MARPAWRVLGSPNGARRFVAGIAVAAIAGGTTAAIFVSSAWAGPPMQPVVSSDVWAPGSTQHAGILIPSTGESAQPYLEVRNLTEACHLDCSPARPTLGALLSVTVTAPDGTQWSGPLNALTGAAVALTGGKVAARSGPRRYEVSLTLPRNTGNEGEGLSAVYDMRWGVMDAHGRPITQVLGVALHRGHDVTSPGNQLGDSDLPFTGFSAFMGLVASLSLIGCGTVLLLAGRRRWRGGSS